MNEDTCFLRTFIQKEHTNSIDTKHADADSTPDRLTRSLQQCGHGTAQTGPCLSGWHILHQPLPSWPRPPAAVRQTQSSVTPNLSRDPVLLAKTARRHSPPPCPAPRAHQSHSLPAQGPAPLPAPGSSWISSVPRSRAGPAPAHSATRLSRLSLSSRPPQRHLPGERWDTEFPPSATALQYAALRLQFPEGKAARTGTRSGSARQLLSASPRFASWEL